MGSGAAVTTSVDMPAKYVIHVVGPKYASQRHHGARATLRSRDHSTQNCRSDERCCRSVALPIISAGIYGCRLEDACEIIANAAYESIWTAKHVKDIHLCGFTNGSDMAGQLSNKVKGYEKKAETVKRRSGFRAIARELCLRFFIVGGLYCFRGLRAGSEVPAIRSLGRLRRVFFDCGRV